jgi:hypothetical protein
MSEQKDAEVLYTKWAYLAKEFNAHTEEQRKAFIDEMMKHPAMKAAVVALGNLASICLDGSEIKPTTLGFLEIMGFHFQRKMVPGSKLDA